MKAAQARDLRAPVHLLGFPATTASKASWMLAEWLAHSYALILGVTMHTLSVAAHVSSTDFLSVIPGQAWQGWVSRSDLSGFQTHLRTRKIA